MAELSLEPSHPPKMKASPWISNIEKLSSAFGNGGPNVIKEEKGTVNEMSFFVGQILQGVPPWHGFNQHGPRFNKGFF